MKSLKYPALLLSFFFLQNSFAATSPDFISWVKAGNFFPGQGVTTQFKCPASYSTKLAGSAIICSQDANKFTLELAEQLTTAENPAEVIRVSGSTTVTCKNLDLQKISAPCSFEQQSQRDTGSFPVYTIKCGDFIQGEIYCAPKRSDLSIGYGEAHRNLIKKAASYRKSTLKVDGESYVRAAVNKKAHLPVGQNYCAQNFKTSTAIALIKKTKATGLANSQIQYAADSKTLSSEFYCSQIVLKKSGAAACPAGMNPGESNPTSTECRSASHNLTELCPAGTKADASGTQNVAVDKDSIATETLELKSDCYRDQCYPGTTESGNLCQLCPTGTKLTAKKSPQGEALCR
jgi:hypothetical protein